MPDNNGFFKQNQLVLLSIALAFLIAGFVYFVGNSEPLFVKATSQKETSHSGTPDIGGAFTMQNQNGENVTQEILLGKNTLMFFGFTHCPDICPMSLMTVTDALAQLPEQMRENFQVIFVTIDPQRDTPELMKEYLANFNKNYIGLSGTEAQLKDMAKKYLVYYAKNPDSHPKHYLMDHSAYIYHFNPQGSYITHYSHKIDPNVLAVDIQENFAQ